MPSSDMLPIDSTDSPLPQPLDPIGGNDTPLPQPVESANVRDAIMSAAVAFAKKAEQWAAAGDGSGAALLLDSAVRAYSAIS